MSKKSKELTGCESKENDLLILCCDDKVCWIYDHWLKEFLPALKKALPDIKREEIESIATNLVQILNETDPVIKYRTMYRTQVHLIAEAEANQPLQWYSLANVHAMLCGELDAEDGNDETDKD